MDLFACSGELPSSITDGLPRWSSPADLAKRVLLPWRKQSMRCLQGSHFGSARRLRCQPSRATHASPALLSSFALCDCAIWCGDHSKCWRCDTKSRNGPAESSSITSSAACRLTCAESCVRASTPAPSRCPHGASVPCAGSKHCGPVPRRWHKCPVPAAGTQAASRAVSVGIFRILLVIFAPCRVGKELPCRL